MITMVNSLMVSFKITLIIELSSEKGPILDVEGVSFRYYRYNRSNQSVVFYF